jgi:hypothetical protein
VILEQHRTDNVFRVRFEVDVTNFVALVVCFMSRSNCTGIRDSEHVKQQNAI